MGNRRRWDSYGSGVSSRIEATCVLPSAEDIAM